MKKTIIYYLVTAALILSLSSCGEISDESSSKAAKPAAQVSVSSEADEVSDSVSLSETESEIDLGFNGEFNEEVFEKICQNVRIGDKIVSFPCTLNDLGDDFELRGERINEEYSYVSGSLFYNSQRIGSITLDGNTAAENEDMTILSFSIFDKETSLDYKTYLGGITIGTSVESIYSSFGEPTDIIEHDSGNMRLEYAIERTKYIAFRTDDSGNVKTISLDLGGE